MKYNHILLTGASGTLGGKIIGLSKTYRLNLLTPQKAVLDITKPDKIKKFFEENDFDAIIHCAAVARMRECHENPDRALQVNTVGTCNLVSQTLIKEKKIKKNIRFVQISTDGVYEGAKGK